jgi:uncharacterized protein (TIGR03435 family)
MKTSLRVALFAAACLATVCAAPASGQAPAFEVVTVKAAAPDDTNWRIEFNTGLLRIENRSVRDMIEFAYDLKSDTQLLNASGWIVSQHFDIQGKEDEALVKALKSGPAEQTAALRRQLVRGILEDRFHLRVQIKTTELLAFALTVAKSGARITPFNPEDGRHFRGHVGPAGHVDGRGTNMQLLADYLSGQPETSGRVVLDKTGLTGEYDWSLRWTPQNFASNPDANAEPDTTPNLLVALEEQLGLRLMPGKYPIPTLFIDHVDKPTEN